MTLTYYHEDLYLCEFCGNLIWSYEKYCKNTYIMCRECRLQLRYNLRSSIKKDYIISK